MVYGVCCTVESSNVRQVTLCVEGRSAIGEGENTAGSATDSDRIRATDSDMIHDHSTGKECD